MKTEYINYDFKTITQHLRRGDREYRTTIKPMNSDGEQYAVFWQRVGYGEFTFSGFWKLTTKQLQIEKLSLSDETYRGLTD